MDNLKQRRQQPRRLGEQGRGQHAAAEPAARHRHPGPQGRAPTPCCDDLGALTWQDANGVLDDEGAAERQRAMQELANLAAAGGLDLSLRTGAAAAPPPPPAPAPGTPPPPPAGAAARRRRAMPPRRRPRHLQAQAAPPPAPRPRAARWAARWRPRLTVSPGALTPPPEH
ncbi:MAG: hypothetical protein R2699_03195 [Acidimicrobiales bacterium]